jgi:hypothetical protein
MLFTVRGYDSGGNEILITPNWSAAEGEISPDGWYTATFWGEDSVTATVPGSDVSATAILEIGPPLERLEIAPSDTSIWLGESLQFAVIGYAVNGDEMPITPHWSTDGGNITYFGLYSASDVGSFTVTVTVPGLGGITDVITSASVIVNQKPDIGLIYIVPLNTSVRPGEQVQYTAVGYETNGVPVNIEPIWQTSGGEITASGLYTASEMGNFTIQASMEDSKVIGLALIEVDIPWYQKWNIWLMIVMFLVGTGGYIFWRWRYHS